LGTSSETNAKEFVIERAGSSLKFSEAAKLPASGGTTSNKSYRWVDQQPLKGINYYRLVLVNVDGTREYFEIKKVFNKASDQRIVVAPNPVERDLNVYFSVDRSQKVNIKLTDVQGRIVFREEKNYQPGIQQINISMARMVAGTYIVELKGEEFSEIRKVFRK